MVNSVDSHPVNDTLAKATAIAAGVEDPELPFLTVHDLGILRAVRLEGEVIVASVSPTYSGCPAVSVIEQSIEQALQQAGFSARIERVMTPPWSTQWITDEGRKKLLENGIAPPVEQSTTMPLLFGAQMVACPLCESSETQKISEFGSTPCKSQYRCNSCGEPFDHFKCH